MMAVRVCVERRGALEVVKDIFAVSVPKRHFYKSWSQWTATVCCKTLPVSKEVVIHHVVLEDGLACSL